MNSLIAHTSLYAIGLFGSLAAPGFAQSLQLHGESYEYMLGPDSKPQEGVPRGTVTEHELLDSSVFPGTVRRYSIYVPAQYDRAAPAALMVFQDGHAYAGGQFRVPVVFDNLIHSGEMPVTIAVFVDPGHLASELPPKRGWQPDPKNRRTEYDTLSPAYAEFLASDLLPLVEAEYAIAKDPELRAIAGLSSGGICAFTAAWERPDLFGKVLSHIGSFTNILGGDAYPGIIRKSETKPIRVYLQDGSADLDNEHGNWWLGNLSMDAALRYKGYDVKFDQGTGGHGGEHGAAVLPGALRWLWRDAPGVTPKLALIPESRDKAWWIQRHEAKLAERRAIGEVDLLMVGDSITHSWENGGRAVWDRFYGNRRAFNIGFSGDRTEHVIWRLQNGAVHGLSPKLAVLMIGTNNTGHRMENADHTAAGIRRVVQEMRMRMPETKVLVLGIFPRAEQPDHSQRQLNDRINAQIQGLGKENMVTYLDVSSSFLDGSGALRRDLMPDLLHPNAEGYEAWAAAMEGAIMGLMK